MPVPASISDDLAALDSAAAASAAASTTLATVTAAEAEALARVQTATIDAEAAKAAQADALQKLKDDLDATYGAGTGDAAVSFANTAREGFLDDRPVLKQLIAVLLKFLPLILANPTDGK